MGRNIGNEKYVNHIRNKMQKWKINFHKFINPLYSFYGLCTLVDMCSNINYDLSVWRLCTAQQFSYFIFSSFPPFGSSRDSIFHPKQINSYQIPNHWFSEVVFSRSFKHFLLFWAFVLGWAGCFHLLYFFVSNLIENYTLIIFLIKLSSNCV